MDLDEEEQLQLEPPSKKDAAAKRKQIDKDGDSFNKQVKAANEIAKACQWVLEQVNVSRISESTNAIFDETHFQAVQLAPNEISWLKAHDSLEKVVHLTCLAYAAAPKWEPYPQSILSVQDLERIESEKYAHRKALEEANRIASQLLTRKGDNADPTMQTIEFGQRNTEWVRERFAIAKTNSSKKKKKKDGLTAITSTIDTHDGTCDVLECNEAVVGSCTIVAESNCERYRYCALHFDHSSHQWQMMKETNTVCILTLKIS